MRTTVVTNPRCPDEPWWHEHDMYSTEMEVQALLSGLVRALQPEVVVETGAYHGHTSAIIGRSLQKNQHGHLHAIEISGNNCVIANMAVRNLPVTIHNMDVNDYHPSEAIDFAFLDDHPDNRYKTFTHLWDYFTPNTIVAIHDTGGAWHQVPIDLQRIEAEGLAKIVELPTPRGIAIAQIKKPPEGG